LYFWLLFISAFICVHLRFLLFFFLLRDLRVSVVIVSS
jgi:hypothetical protein